MKRLNAKESTELTMKILSLVSADSRLSASDIGRAIGWRVDRRLNIMVADGLINRREFGVKLVYSISESGKELLEGI